MKKSSLMCLAFWSPHWNPKATETKRKCSFVREACVAFFPTWSLTQSPTQFLEFYWFRMLSWIRKFLATNGKGYDNSRFSDDIDRGSRQILDKCRVTLYLSLMYLVTKWTWNENLSQASIEKFHNCTTWSSDRNFYSSA